MRNKDFAIDMDQRAGIEDSLFLMRVDSTKATKETDRYYDGL